MAFAGAAALLTGACTPGDDDAANGSGQTATVDLAAAACPAATALVEQRLVDGVCVASFRPFTALAAAAEAADGPAVAPVDPLALFAWAERRYPFHFGGAPVDGTGDGYRYRFYPRAGNYISVKDGELFLSGSVSQGATLPAGSLTSMAPVVSASSGKTWTCTDGADLQCLGFDTGGLGLTPFGGLTAGLASDPLDPANPVARLVKPSTGETWAGATLYKVQATNTVDPIGFAGGSVFTLRVHAPAAGEKFMLKLEGSTNGGVDLESEATTVGQGAWETLSFDFSRPTIGSFEATRRYTKVSVFPHFGTKVSSSRTYYIDELKLKKPAAGAEPSGHTGTCKVTAQVNCLDFEGQSTGLLAFGGASAAYAVDPADAGNDVVRLVKRTTSDIWAGAVIGPGSNAATVTPVRFGANRLVTLRVYSPAAGEKIMLKLENAASAGSVYVAAEATTVGRNAWETLRFDFDRATEGSYDRAVTYDKVVVLPHRGAKVSADTTFYFDELSLKTEDKLTGWNLVWSDEFSTDGLPSASKWDYDTERNPYGWYNNELQYYARARLANSSVAGGRLTIKAIRENLSGSVSDWGPPNQQYTSARLITRGKASWTYGFFEIRAKLPCSLGTWPAIWMLGTGGRWPEDGEIDIMEQKGIATGDKGQVLGTVHNFASRNGLLGGVSQGSQTAVADACTAFHNYQLNWNAERIVMSIDDRNFFTYLNPKNGDTQKWPFDNPQYLLLNIAMGGDLGGAVPPGFTSDTMQVEYVRVYQK
jgi:beta-glucanase (GH16 family)